LNVHKKQLEKQLREAAKKSLDTIFVKKYGSFSPTKWGGGCKNPFPAILRQQKM